MAERKMTRAEYEELIKQEKKAEKKSRPKKSVGAKKQTGYHRYCSNHYH